MSAPSERSASTSGPTGRSCIRAEPVRVTSVPSVAAYAASRKRAAVPQSATSTIPPLRPSASSSTRVSVQSGSPSAGGIGAPGVRRESSSTRAATLLLSGSLT